EPEDRDTSRVASARRARTAEVVADIVAERRGVGQRDEAEVDRGVLRRAIRATPYTGEALRQLPLVLRVGATGRERLEALDGVEVQLTRDRVGRACRVCEELLDAGVRGRDVVHVERNRVTNDRRVT